MPRTGCSLLKGIRLEERSKERDLKPLFRGDLMSFGLDLGGLLLDQLDQMVDDAGVLQPMVRHAGDIDLVRAAAAPGEADVGLACLAGAVWGHLVGDALGVPYEFAPAGEIGAVTWGHRGTHGQPAGTWSDDGGLMLALLDSLLSAGFDLADQAQRALRWLEGPDYKPGAVFDVGNTTKAALDRLKSGTPPEQAGGRDEQDNGNGSLMRILPVALVGHDLEPERLIAQACRSSKLTHAHPRSQAVCALYCLVVQLILRGETRRDQALAQALVSASRHLPPGVKGELETIRRYSQRSGSTYVIDAFWSAWEAFAVSASYRETVERAVRYGNDTDTTAAIAGGLAGAYWGLEAIPAEWRRGMRAQETASRLVDRLLRTA